MVLPIAELVADFPTAVEVALAVHEELAVVIDSRAVALPIVAVASTGSVEVPAVVERGQPVRHEPCGRFEGVARCTTQGELPKQ